MVMLCWLHFPCHVEDVDVGLWGIGGQGEADFSLGGEGVGGVLVEHGLGLGCRAVNRCFSSTGLAGWHGACPYIAAVHSGKASVQLIDALHKQGDHFHIVDKYKKFFFITFVI